MSPQIKIDDEVFEALKRQALPFQDREPNDVMRRLLLDGDKSPLITPPTETSAPIRASEGTLRQRAGKASKRSKRSKRKRTPTSALMPEMEYRYPILRVISDNGGRVPTSEAVAAVGELVKDKLLPADLEMLGKKPRWEARAQFTRLRLIEEGLMKKDSPRGVWEITNEGEEAVKKQLRSDAVASPRAKRAMAGAS